MCAFSSSLPLRGRGSERLGVDWPQTPQCTNLNVHDSRRYQGKLAVTGETFNIPGAGYPRVMFWR